ncbi:hypothetical protein ACFLZ0_01245 [Patescibacteria group bacterium]
MNKKSATRFYIIILAVGLVLVANGLILAWTGPSQNPPAGNVPAPINVGATQQEKSGRIGVSTGGVDPNYGLTVGNNSTYGIKSDKWSWFGDGLRADGWEFDNDFLTDDGDEVIRTTDEWLRLNQFGDFAQGVFTPGILRAEGGLYVSDDESFHRAGEDIIGTSDSLAVDGNITVAGQNVCRQNGVNCPAGGGGGVLGPNTVGSIHVIDNSLTAADLAPNSVGSSEIIEDSITGAQIKDSVDFPGNVRIGKLLVTNCKICLGWADTNGAFPERTTCHSLNSATRINSNFLQLRGEVSDDDRLWIWWECD